MTDGDGDVGHLQRRDLQLRRAARGARASAASARPRTPRCILRAYRQLGRGLPGAAARHVRVRALGRVASRRSSARATASASSRSTTRSRRRRPATSPPRPRRCCRSCRRSRPTSRACRTTSPSSSCLARQDALPAASRSCCRATTCVVRDGQVAVRRYWEVQYEPDFDHTERYFSDRARRARARTPCGCTCAPTCRSAPTSPAGSTRASSRASPPARPATPSRASPAASTWARSSTRAATPAISPSRRRSSSCTRSTIGARGLRTITCPTSSTTSTSRSPARAPFPQYMVSKLAAQHVKVVLGGQGGDEIFGGYARYLIAYFEQCIKAAIEGTMHDGNFVVTYESIIPNLSTLREYKPLLQEFWREGLFEDLDRALLPPRRPRAAARRRDRPGRRSATTSPFETLPPHLPGRQRAQGVVLRLA